MSLRKNGVRWVWETVIFRDIFHLQYSGIFIPLVYATGAGFMLAERFRIAYVLFAVSGVWACCYWLCSDFLRSKRTALQSKNIRRSALLLSRTQKRVLAWELLGVVIIWALVGASLFEARRLKVEAELKADHGWLYPDHESDPYGVCHPSDGQLAMYVGSYSLLANSFHRPLSRFARFQSSSLIRRQMAQ